MKSYQKSIAVFGLAIPVLLAVVFCTVCLVIKGKLSDKATEREIAFNEHSSVQKQVNALSGRVGPKKPKIEHWETVLTDDIRPTLQKTLTNIQNQFTSKQFGLTAIQSTPGSSGRLANGAKQTSSAVKMEFRGTFLPSQTAFHQLESDLPQLALDSMTITTPRGYNDLKFNLSYTVWEKTEK